MNPEAVEAKPRGTANSQKVRTPQVNSRVLAVNIPHKNQPTEKVLHPRKISGRGRVQPTTTRDHSQGINLGGTQRMPIGLMKELLKEVVREHPANDYFSGNYEEKEAVEVKKPLKSNITRSPSQLPTSRMQVTHQNQFVPRKSVEMKDSTLNRRSPSQRRRDHRADVSMTRASPCPHDPPSHTHPDYADDEMQETPLPSATYPDPLTRQ